MTWENEGHTARLQRLLSSHVGFLKRSCWLFDQGHEDEALRIATTLRVLFHDTGQSTSLLTHLGWKSSATMLGTPREYEGVGWWRDFFGVRIELASPEPVRAIAACGTTQYIAQPVDQWWDGEVLFAHEGVSCTRRSVVTAMANRDGGAHVDLRLQQFYKQLIAHSDGLGLDAAGIEWAGRAPFDTSITQYARNAHLVLMRVFAHEVLSTSRWYDWPVTDRPIVPWVAYPESGSEAIASAAPPSE